MISPVAVSRTAIILASTSHLQLRWEEKRADTPAFLMEVCSLLSTCTLPRTARIILDSLVSLLRPDTSSSTTLPPPNDHLLVLRCLASLPVSSWDGQLQDDEMGTVMRGLESGDEGVRRAVSLPSLEHTL